MATPTAETAAIAAPTVETTEHAAPIVEAAAHGAPSSKTTIQAAAQPSTAAEQAMPAARLPGDASLSAEADAEQTPAGDVSPNSVALGDLEREVLAEEVASFAATLRDADSRARYEQLGAAVGQGAVPPELTGALETLLELLLPTQRIRLHHGHEADGALHRLWQRTPRGAALAQGAREVNEALGALRGQVLEGLAFTPTPRGHRLLVETERCRLTLAIDRGGVRVENVELGG